MKLGTSKGLQDYFRKLLNKWKKEEKRDEGKRSKRKK